jgi:hypothetical protein
MDTPAPGLPEPYATALREAEVFIRARTKPLGIVACGTIIRGDPDVSSDLDLYVIHDRPWRQRVQRRFNDVPAEIFINPPAAIERYFREEHADGQPLTAHMLATGVVLGPHDAIVDGLVAQSREWLARPPTPSAFDLEMARYSAATVFEDALDVAERDRATATMLLAMAVRQALHYLFLRDRILIPRNKELLARSAQLDPEVGAAARRFFDAPTWSERLAASGIVMDRSVGTRGFYEWESEPEAA